MQEMVLDDREIGHANVDQGHERIDSSAAILRDDNVAPPCVLFVEGPTLNLAYSFVDREGYTCPRD